MLADIRRDIRSPNFDSQRIRVEFAVIHYTAGSLRRALDLFSDPKRQVSAHLIIDRDGTMYETVPCIDDGPFMAWHAGRSHWIDLEQKTWREFNQFSIGIELVNENGNVIPYENKQYESLVALLQLLGQRYPALKQPERIIGHEQIAGHRGKSDPGLQFDWERVFKGTFGEIAFPLHRARLPRSIIPALEAISSHAPCENEARDAFYSQLSQVIEQLRF